MKVFVLLILIALVFIGHADDNCPEEIQIKCVDDFRKAYPVCKKAAESGGSDITDVLACLKYYSTTRTECWPCICMIAHMEHVTIKGCD